MIPSETPNKYDCFSIFPSRTTARSQHVFDVIRHRKLASLEIASGSDEGASRSRKLLTIATRRHLPASGRRWLDSSRRLGRWCAKRGQRRFTTSTVCCFGRSSGSPSERWNRCRSWILGCGVGSSLFYLASQAAFQGTGVTLSGVQARWARGCQRTVGARRATEVHSGKLLGSFRFHQSASTLGVFHRGVRAQPRSERVLCGCRSLPCCRWLARSL